MCGRFVLKIENAPLVVGSMPVAFPAYENYNVAPGQYVPIIRAQADRLKWGLVPFWSRAPKTRYSLINARAESIDHKPSFREAFTKRRCIVVASGFYEWKKVPGGKQPYFIGPATGDYFYFAGIWEKWTDGDEILETFAIITTAANAIMAPVHHRMPVILSGYQALAWIEAADKELLKPCGNDQLTLYPVGKAVNSPKNNGPGLIQPL